MVSYISVRKRECIFFYSYLAINCDTNVHAAEHLDINMGTSCALYRHADQRTAKLRRA